MCAVRPVSKKGEGYAQHARSRHSTLSSSFFLSLPLSFSLSSFFLSLSLLSLSLPSFSLYLRESFSLSLSLSLSDSTSSNFLPTREWISQIQPTLLLLNFSLPYLLQPLSSLSPSLIVTHVVAIAISVQSM